jgi:indole-3-glycerol phosphate synthase
MTILEEIIIHKKKELAEAIERVTVKDLEKRKFFSRKPILTDYILALRRRASSPSSRKSPSRGIINSEAILEEVTTGYFISASGLSILTDREFFGGSAADLERARELNPIPILRKDFVIDEYQIMEAKALGADAILLIAAVLDKKHTKQLAGFAHSLGLQVLLEVHGSKELDQVNEFVDIIGVNNRDLKPYRGNRSLGTARPRDPSGFVNLKVDTSAIIIKN